MRLQTMTGNTCESDVINKSIEKLALRRFKHTIVIFLECMICISFVSAATYYVSISGSDNAPGTSQQPWRTVQKAASTIQAGDTAIVTAGSYDEYIIPANSGTKGQPIVFRANGKAVIRGFSITDKRYITIDGFEITDSGFSQKSHSNSIYLESTEGITITNNKIHHTYAQCIKLHQSGPAQHTIISKNIISYCGYPGNGASGIDLTADYTLIDGNDLSHVDNFIVMEGIYNVARNNVLHDSFLSDWPNPSDSHMDGFESTLWLTPLKHALLENNIMYNVPDRNTHFGLFRDTGLAGASDIILRHNSINNIGAYFLVLSDNYRNVRIYGNTVVNVQSGVTKEYADLTVTDNCPGAKIINNIFYDNVRSGGYIYYVDQSSLTGFYASNNLAYIPSCGASCTWQSTLFPYINTITNKDPSFVSAKNDLNLQPNSPAIDAGGPLTSVSPLDSGSGISLKVMDAGMFQDGWAGVQPDWISIGNPASTSQISSIDYANHIITLASPLSRKSGDPVWLFKDSSGRQVLYGAAPDIGAYEYTSSQQKCSDGTNYGACSSAKPKYCQNGALIDNCQACGCNSGLDCQGSSCVIVQQCIPGDLNCDKKVDIFDLVLVAQNYGKTSGFDLKADANKDGKIDIFDLVIVAQNYGKTG